MQFNRNLGSWSSQVSAEREFHTTVQSKLLEQQIFRCDYFDTAPKANKVELSMVYQMVYRRHFARDRVTIQEPQTNVLGPT